MPITRYKTDQLLTFLAAQTDGTPFWGRDDALDCLNEAMSLYNLLTGYWRTRVSLITTASTVEYVLPAALVVGSRLQVDTVPMTSSALFDLDNGRPGWRTETTTAGGDVPTQPSLWAPLSLTRIAIWPQDAVGGATLLVDGVAVTPFLVSPSTVVDLDETGLGAVLACALHLLSFSEGSERFAATLPRFHAFLTICAGKNSQLEASAWYRRYLGLDRQKDFRPTRGGTTGATQVAQAGAPDA